MQFSTKVIALVSVLSAGALASDVYAAFDDSNGAQIGGTTFDVSNNGCFSVPNAVEINFTQGGIDFSNAAGPYCLTGFSAGGCSGTATSQQFQNVDVNGGQKYELNSGLASVGSYRWTAQAC